MTIMTAEKSLGELLFALPAGMLSDSEDGLATDLREYVLWITAQTDRQFTASQLPPEAIRMDGNGYLDEMQVPFTEADLQDVLRNLANLAQGTEDVNGSGSQSACLLYRVIRKISRRERTSSSSRSMSLKLPETFCLGTWYELLWMLDLYADGQDNILRGGIAPLAIALGDAIWQVAKVQMKERVETMTTETQLPGAPMMDEAMAAKALAVGAGLDPQAVPPVVPAEPQQYPVVPVADGDFAARCLAVPLCRPEAAPVGAVPESEPVQLEGETSETHVEVIPVVVEPSPGVAAEDSATLPPLVQRYLALVDQNAALREQTAALQAENAVLRKQVAALSGLCEELAAIRQQLASVTQLHIRVDDHEERLAALEANQADVPDEAPVEPKPAPEPDIADPNVLAEAVCFLRGRQSTTSPGPETHADFTRSGMPLRFVPAGSVHPSDETGCLSWEGKRPTEMEAIDTRIWLDYLLDVCIHDFPEEPLVASARLGRESRKRDSIQTVAGIRAAITRLRLRYLAQQAGVRIDAKNLRAMVVHVSELGFTAESILGVYIGNQKQAASKAVA